MNAKNREIAMCYAIARYGRKCYHCSTSIEELINEAEMKCELTGKERKLPVILLDKKNNDGQHNDPTDPDLVPSCYSCNRNKNKHNLSQTSGREPSREKLDSLKHEPIYHNNLRFMIIDNEHVCFNEMKYAGKELSEGMNEVTCLRYYRSQKITKANSDGIYSEFPYNCGSSDCNGVHVTLVNTIPKTILIQEVYDLKKDYDKEYMSGDRERFQSHSSTMLREFITFREYYTQRTNLLKYFPDAKINELLESR